MPDSLSPISLRFWSRTPIPFRKDVIALGALALLVLGVFSDPIFLARTFLRRDMGVYFLPVEAAIHREWSALRLPIWWDGATGGRPLLPNPNAGVFYPLRMLGALLPFSVYFKLFPVALLIIAGWGAYLLARELDCSREGSMVAAAVLAFSGPVMSEILLMALLPGLITLVWTFWAIVRLGKSPSARRMAALALVLGIGLLDVDPFSLGLAEIVCLIWLVFEVPQERRKPAALRWIGANALGALLAGIQVVPTLLYVGQTDRALGGLKTREALYWTLHPIRLLEWLIPYPFGRTDQMIPAETWGGRFFDGAPTGFFFSLFMGTFAAIALVETFRRPRPHRRATLGLLAVSLLLACAPLLIPTRGFMVATPLGLRYPEKFAVGAAVAVAILVAQEWDRRTASRELGWWPAAVAVCLALLAWAAAVWKAPASVIARWTRANVISLPALRAHLPGALLSGASHWLAGFLAVALLCGLGRRRSAWRLLAAAVILADVLAATRSMAPSSPESLIAQPPPAARAIARLDPGRQYCLFPLADYLKAEETPARKAFDPDGARQEEVNRLTLSGVSSSYWGIPSIFNIDPDFSDLYRMGSLQRLFSWYLAPKDRSRLVPFLAGLSAGFAVRWRDQVPLPGSSAAAYAGPIAVDRFPGAVRRIRLATDWVEVPDATAAWKRLLTVADPPGRAILETGRLAAGESGRGSLKILNSRPSGFDLETESAEPTWLVVTRQFWTWREVRIDGAPATPVPERVALSAVRIPAGAHRVTWRERIPGGAAGSAMTVAGCLLLALAWRSTS